MQDEYGTGFGGEVKQQELPRVGAHQAICCQVHSLGIRYFKGVPDLNPTGVFIFELDENLTQGPMAGKPFVMSERFQQYMGSTKKHSKLRQFLQAWAGSEPRMQITDEKAKTMRIDKWKGFPCTLLINHVPHKEVAGIRVAKIVGISPADPSLPRMKVTYTEMPAWVLREKEDSRKMAAMRGFDPQDQRPDRMAAAVPSGMQPAQAPAAAASARANVPPVTKEDDLPF